jgi:ADP-ribose pyrophosphatase
MTEQDVDIIGKDTPFKGFFRIDRYRIRHRLYAGGWSKPLEREVFERGHAVGVLLYDPVLDQVVLVEQFRIGAFAAGWKSWVLEVVAGMIGEGEAPEEVARRETLEETGCVAGELVDIAEYQPSSGASTETMRLYCARVDASGAGGIHGLPSEGEDIRVVTMPAEEAIGLLQTGGAENATLIIALYWLAHHRHALRARWNGEPAS